MGSVSGTISSTQEDTPRASPHTTHPYLFRVVDCARPLIPPARYRLSGLDEVAIGRGTDNARRVTQGGARVLELTVSDPRVSSVHATMRKMLGRWVIEDAGSRNGVIRNGVREPRAVVSDGDVLELGQTFFIFRAGLGAPGDAPADFEATDRLDGMSTLLPQLATELMKLEGIARSTVDVVIHGESGTGKELVAHAIHAMSGRTGPFVPVNCGALPETLVETELFGYRKGAFSGANEDRAGLVRSAERGTLFLDEIGDLPKASQAAFLRVLQEREVTPVGATKAVPVDIRLCAATHRSLDALVEAGEFRGDLFARISGYTVHVPALRDRREDIGLIIASLLRRSSREGVTFTKDAARAFLRYDWPLNIRELQKCLESSIVVAAGAPVGIEHLPAAIKHAPPRTDHSTPEDHATGASASAAPPQLSREDQERRDQMIGLLREHHGNISAVARVMGKERVQIRRWLQRYQLDPESFK